MGGHIVQGHVDGVARFVGLEPIANADDFWLHVDIPEELEKYVVFKGSIAVEGISLTVAKLEGLRLTIAIIPHTVKMTNLGSLKPGDPVNIETDIVAKYLEKWTKRDERRRADGGSTGGARVLSERLSSDCSESEWIRSSQGIV